ncbi:MAG: hypothetical protein QFX32_04375 [Methanolinea sp.]|nr:hypothetical protein [Methanolinea sp.]
MVNESGQLYTIEGIAASVLVLTTLYMVLNTTTILTPGETHISDMQLEQLGNDILAVMDVNPEWTDSGDGFPESPLQQYIQNNDDEGFKNHFNNLARMAIDGVNEREIYFAAYLTYRTNEGIKTEPFFEYWQFTREHAVKVTRWVNVDNRNGQMNSNYPGIRAERQTVLLEVLLWRG